LRSHVQSFQGSARELEADHREKAVFWLPAVDFDGVRNWGRMQVVNRRVIALAFEACVVYEYLTEAAVRVAPLSFFREFVRRQRRGRGAGVSDAIGP
jgi:hypothetical protein